MEEYFFSNVLRVYIQNNIQVLSHYTTARTPSPATNGVFSLPPSLSFLLIIVQMKLLVVTCVRKRGGRGRTRPVLVHGTVRGYSVWRTVTNGVRLRPGGGEGGGGCVRG